VVLSVGRRVRAGAPFLRGAARGPHAPLRNGERVETVFQRQRRLRSWDKEGHWGFRVPRVLPAGGDGERRDEDAAAAGGGEGREEEHVPLGMQATWENPHAP